MKPIVAIVGHPNSGKSTLFNRISKERRSLVDDIPGVTRDRLYNEVTWNGKSFILIDTGGFEPSSKEPLLAQMREQTELAIQEADVILFLLDSREGLTSSDRDTAERLRCTAKPVHYVVNKVDGPRHEPLALEFFELGAEPLHLISAKYGRNVSDLLDDLTKDFAVSEAPPRRVSDGIRVAVVGRPNVGKSSLVNFICGEERSLVSSVPGTTHDAVDTEVRWHGKRFVLIDTAGIRRKSRTRLPLEKYCVLMALRSIDRCDVALLLLDAQEAGTDQDARIGGYILERGRGCVVIANKWDLVQKDHRTHDQYVKGIYQALRHLDFAPVLTLSARTGQRVGRLLSMVEQVYRSCGRRAPTSELNQLFQRWVIEHAPPMRKGHRIKFFYITQPEVHPPTFVVFCNHPKSLSPTYRRYLTNRIHERFDFHGAPIRLIFRPRDRK
jgi:GTP-binding protein